MKLYNYVTFYFDEEYSDICRMIFDRYWVHVNPIRANIEARKIEGDISKWASEHQKDWCKITGFYGGEDGKLIYKVRQKDIQEISKVLELLHRANIVRDYLIDYFVY